MNYTNELLNRVKVKYSLTSDYQLAKKLGIGQGRLHNWRKGLCSMDWDIAFQVADLLQEDDQNVVHGIIDDKYTNPRLISALHAGQPA